MKIAATALIMVLVGLSTQSGCRETPPPPRVPVPQQYDRQTSRMDADEIKPLPPSSYPNPGDYPPFGDPPLVSQRPPEQRAFVESYRQAGSPRVVLFVAAQEDADVAAIDFNAIEAIMTDWLASNGQVTLVAPTIARRRLSDPQTRDNLSKQLGADVAIYVQAGSSRQTIDGKDVRIVAQAINTRGGEQIGRAVVDVPPPLDKVQINDYTRYLARKLMDDMTATWSAAPRSTPTAP